MNVKYFWLVPVFTFIIGSKVHLSRSANQELERLKGNSIEKPQINLDEYWPFPKAISEANPSLFELEQQLLSL